MRYFIAFTVFHNGHVKGYQDVAVEAEVYPSRSDLVRMACKAAGVPIKYQNATSIVSVTEVTFDEYDAWIR